MWSVIAAQPIVAAVVIVSIAVVVSATVMSLSGERTKRIAAQSQAMARIEEAQTRRVESESQVRIREINQMVGTMSCQTITEEADRA